MTTLLFAGVRDTWLELLGDEASLGAQPGIMATLHTWSQTRLLHRISTVWSPVGA